MHPRTDCPHWDYENHPNRPRILSTAATKIIEDLLKKKIDTLKLLIDTRPIHLRLFKELAPRGREYLAGHYRGEQFKCLRHCPVGIPSNPLVGVPPFAVRLELQKLEQVLSTAIRRLDALHKPESSALPGEEKLIGTVEVACRIFAEFLRIHPYANGNGHVGRFCLLAILLRYGYWPRHFPLEPRPPDPPYSDAVRAYQHGFRESLEQFVLSCIRGGK
jgi:fido (protein-threonine AMPylation protein)